MTIGIDNLKKFRKEYLSRKSDYENSAKLMEQYLNSIIKNLGVNYSIESRVKDVDSFIKKLIRKECSDPFLEIRDQIGIRIITTYKSELDEIDEKIHDNFHVINRENKIDSLSYNELGYLGIHLEVSLQGVESLADSIYNYTVCEIQLHTRAQNLWASVSHQLSYKTSTEPSTSVRRSIYRLVSLIEIFDTEVTTAKATILSQSEIPEVILLNDLEKYFYGFSAKQFDREFSLQNLSILKNLLSKEEIKNFEKFVGEFVDTNRVQLTQIFNNYSQDGRDSYKKIMLYQPESILIFWRLKKDRFKLLEIWKDLLPRELLEFMADVWGIGLPSNN